MNNDNEPISTNVQLLFHNIKMPTASNPPEALVVCVECGHPVSCIYKEYSRGNIRLSRCVSVLFGCFCYSRMCLSVIVVVRVTSSFYLALSDPIVQRKCRKIADPFVEFEAVLLFIDMMLHKVSVYRHLLINRTPLSQYRQTGGGLPVSWRSSNRETAASASATMTPSHRDLFQH